MSSTGAGYDQSCSQFSPDGRIFQTEYAMKAVESSGTAVGMKCKDGIVLAVEKPQLSKMLVSGSNRRIFGIDKHVGGCITGFPSDGRQIINRAREEANSYNETYGHPIVPSILANRLALFTHFYTIHYSLRPFGCSLLFIAYDEDTKTPELYMVEPSGMTRRYFGCAAGKGTQGANTELEKLYNKVGGSEGITCAEAANQLAQIIYTVRDSSNDKPFELEMAWCCEDSDYNFRQVPKDILAAADAFGSKNAQATAAVAEPEAESSEVVSEEMVDEAKAEEGIDSSQLMED